MGIVYTATIYVFLKQSDGVYAETGERTEFRRLNNFEDLKAEVNVFIAQEAKKHDCLVDILFERNGEYQDSEEVICESGGMR